MVFHVIFPADSTGTHSLFAKHGDNEIMFHVSTMLPYTANNKQQVGNTFFYSMLKSKWKFWESYIDGLINVSRKLLILLIRLNLWKYDVTLYRKKSVTYIQNKNKNSRLQRLKMI